MLETASYANELAKSHEVDSGEMDNQTGVISSREEQLNNTDQSVNLNESNILQHQQGLLLSNSSKKDPNNRTTIDMNQMSVNNKQRELQLPKTKLSKHGQILLYTNHDNELKDYMENNLYDKNGRRVKAKFNKTGGSYQKKWLKNLASTNAKNKDGVYLDFSDILNEKFQENLQHLIATERNTLNDKAGRNTDYFINGLRHKSGKDRYMNRVPYSQYLPPEFNTKIVSLNADTLKTNEMNNRFTSHKSRTSTSIYSQENEISSEEDNDEASFRMSASTKTQSRLSGQPVLSAQQLINRLNFKSTAAGKGSLFYQQQSGKLETLVSSSVDISNTNEKENNNNLGLGNSLLIKYKETFNFNDDTDDEVNEKPNYYSYDLSKKQIYEVETPQKKILIKRNENKQTKKVPQAETNVIHSLNIPNNQTNDNLKTVRINSVNTTIAPVSSSFLPSRDRRMSLRSVKSSSIKSMPATNVLTNEKSNLFISTLKQQNDEENFPVLNNSHQGSKLHQGPAYPYTRQLDSAQYHIRPGNNSIANLSLKQKNEEQENDLTPGDYDILNNKNDFIFSTDVTDENTAPITISVTEIENDITGQTVKVRRYYDRETLRIKKLELNRLGSSNYAKKGTSFSVVSNSHDTSIRRAYNHSDYKSDVKENREIKEVSYFDIKEKLDRRSSGSSSARLINSRPQSHKNYETKEPNGSKPENFDNNLNDNDDTDMKYEADDAYPNADRNQKMNGHDLKYLLTPDLSQISAVSYLNKFKPRNSVDETYVGLAEVDNDHVDNSANDSLINDKNSIIDENKLKISRTNSFTHNDQPFMSSFPQTNQIQSNSDHLPIMMPKQIDDYKNKKFSFNENTTITNKKDSTTTDNSKRIPMPLNLITNNFPKFDSQMKNFNSIVQIDQKLTQKIERSETDENGQQSLNDIEKVDEDLIEKSMEIFEDTEDDTDKYFQNANLEDKKDIPKFALLQQDSIPSSPKSKTSETNQSSLPIGLENYIKEKESSINQFLEEESISLSKFSSTLNQLEENKNEKFQQLPTVVSSPKALDTSSFNPKTQKSFSNDANILSGLNSEDIKSKARSNSLNVSSNNDSIKFNQTRNKEDESKKKEQNSQPDFLAYESTKSNDLHANLNRDFESIQIEANAISEKAINSQANALAHETKKLKPLSPLINTANMSVKATEVTYNKNINYNYNVKNNVENEFFAKTQNSLLLGNQNDTQNILENQDDENKHEIKKNVSINEEKNTVIILQDQESDVALNSNSDDVKDEKIGEKANEIIGDELDADENEDEEQTAGSNSELNFSNENNNVDQEDADDVNNNEAEKIEQIKREKPSNIENSNNQKQHEKKAIESNELMRVENSNKALANNLVSDEHTIIKSLEKTNLNVNNLIDEKKKDEAAGGNIKSNNVESILTNRKSSPSATLNKKLSSSETVKTTPHNQEEIISTTKQTENLESNYTSDLNNQKPLSNNKNILGISNNTNTLYNQIDGYSRAGKLNSEKEIKSVNLSNLVIFEPQSQEDLFAATESNNQMGETARKVKFSSDVKNGHSQLEQEKSGLSGYSGLSDNSSSHEYKISDNQSSIDKNINEDLSRSIAKNIGLGSSLQTTPSNNIEAKPNAGIPIAKLAKGGITKKGKGKKSSKADMTVEINQDPAVIAAKMVEIEERERRVLELKKKNDKSAKYPHLPFPWTHEEAIADPVVYYEKFQIPDILCPHLRDIDPQKVSIDELILERRILEEKVLELRNSKLGNLNLTSNPGSAKKETVKEKKKAKSKNKEETVSKDKDMKEKIFNEERIRLQTENLKKQIEREKLFNMMIDSLNQKEIEMVNLNKQLEINDSQFEENLNQIESQIKYLEKSEDEIREVIIGSRSEIRKQMHDNNLVKRKNLKASQDEKKEEKMFQFNVKRKELDWLLKVYNDKEEIDKVNEQKAALDIEIEEWTIRYENDCIDQEKQLEDMEEEQDNKLTLLEHQEEENAVKSLKQEQFDLMQEKMGLIENYEAMKIKIKNRIKKIENEKEAIEKDKISFEENTKNCIEQQKEKLIEILRDEQESREAIRSELEQYRSDLMSKREKNLKMKYSLSFMKHCHALTKPYVFSYGVEWPLEVFAKSGGSDKKKGPVKVKK